MNKNKNDFDYLSFAVLFTPLIVVIVILVLLLSINFNESPIKNEELRSHMIQTRNNEKEEKEEKSNKGMLKYIIVFRLMR